MELILSGKIINTSITRVLNDVSIVTNGAYFNIIKSSNDDWVLTQCPYHKGGRENHPSFGVYANRQTGDRTFGTFHCFTCHQSGSLIDLVAYCLQLDDKSAKQWLIDRYADTFLEYSLNLPKIELDTKQKPKVEYLEEHILNEYNHLHPYILSRHIKRDVIRKYKIGFDPKTRCVTFPMWDIKDNLIAINKRSVDRKQYELQANRFKAVYLLNFAIKENAKRLYVCESQINALTLCGYGLTAVALCGTGSSAQYSILKYCGIDNFVLCLDGDEAGRKGTDKFLKNVCTDSTLVSIKDIPDGKDVNDLTQEQFNRCKELDTWEWRNKYGIA